MMASHVHSRSRLRQPPYDGITHGGQGHQITPWLIPIYYSKLTLILHSWCTHSDDKTPSCNPKSVLIQLSCLNVWVRMEIFPRWRFAKSTLILKKKTGMYMFWMSGWQKTYWNSSRRRVCSQQYLGSKGIYVSAKTFQILQKCFVSWRKKEDLCISQNILNFAKLLCFVNTGLIAFSQFLQSLCKLTENI